MRTEQPKPLALELADFYNRIGHYGHKRRSFFIKGMQAHRCANLPGYGNTGGWRMPTSGADVKGAVIKPFRSKVALRLRGTEPQQGQAASIGCTIAVCFEPLSLTRTECYREEGTLVGRFP
jgi:hypothetical protein